MLAFLLAGLVVGFSLGWGVYWYLQQDDRETWRVVAVVRNHHIAQEIMSRLQEPEPVVGGELFERMQNIVEQDAAARTRASSSGALHEEPTEIKYLPDDEGVAEDESTTEEFDTIDAEPIPVDEEQPDSSAPDDHDETHEVEIPDGAVIAYCLKCQTRQPIHDEHRTQTRTGRVAVRGVCEVCGSELFTFVSGD